MKKILMIFALIMAQWLHTRSKAAGIITRD